MCRVLAASKPKLSPKQTSPHGVTDKNPFKWIALFIVCYGISNNRHFSVMLFICFFRLMNKTKLFVNKMLKNISLIKKILILNKTINFIIF